MLFRSVSNGGNDTLSIEGNAGDVAHTFETAWPVGWTVIDNDADGNAWGWFGPGYGHTGGNATGVFYNSAGNDDWLISPTIEVAAGDHFSFFAKSYSSSWLEDVNVMLSTTGGSAIADFDVTLGSYTALASDYEIGRASCRERV